MWGRSCQPCGIPKEGGHASDTKPRPALAWLRRNSPGGLPRRGWHPLRLWPAGGQASKSSLPLGVLVCTQTLQEGQWKFPWGQAWRDLESREQSDIGQLLQTRVCSFRFPRGGRKQKEREQGREGETGMKHSTDCRRAAEGGRLGGKVSGAGDKVPTERECVPEKERRPRGRAGKNGHSKSTDVVGLRVQGECWTGRPAVRGTQDPSGTGSCDTTAQNQAESRGAGSSLQVPLWPGPSICLLGKHDS